MKYSGYATLLLSLFLMACSQDQLQALSGNIKHSCDTKTTVLASVRNLSGKDLSIHFCSNTGTQSIDQVVPADQSGHTYTVATFEHKDSFYDSAAESCSDKGITDSSTTDSSAVLIDDEAKDYSLCANISGSDPGVTPAYEDAFIVISKGAQCPYGFDPYDLSRSSCK